MNLFAAPALIATAYHVFAAVAGVRKLLERPRPSSFAPPISILKPVRGTDQRFWEAIESHALMDYPEFEILFGMQRADDPARPEIESLIVKYPELSIRLLVTPTDALNGKVGVMEQLALHARHDVLLVNDSDILVPPSYLREIACELEDQDVGLVTCLYRGRGGSLPTACEALGVATEFGPSVLVARQVGVNEFAMGSTLLFRARDLARAGGFAAIRDYLADDYQLGKRLTALGLRVVLGRPVVETWLGSGSWRDVWKHQVRWSRTIRVSRPSGYFGYVVTHAVFWCLLAAATGNAGLATACYLIRMLCGLFLGRAVLGDKLVTLAWLAIPLRDLFGFAAWVAGTFGDQVEWRDKKMTIEQSGKIQSSGVT